MIVVLIVMIAFLVVVVVVLSGVVFGFSQVCNWWIWFICGWKREMKQCEWIFVFVKVNKGEWFYLACVDSFERERERERDRIALYTGIAWSLYLSPFSLLPFSLFSLSPLNPSHVHSCLCLMKQQKAFTIHCSYFCTQCTNSSLRSFLSITVNFPSSPDPLFFFPQSRLSIKVSNDQGVFSPFFPGNSMLISVYFFTFRHLVHIYDYFYGVFCYVI